MAKLYIYKKRLTDLEYRLLALLIDKCGTIVDRDTIAATLNPNSSGDGVSNEAIDQLVSRLRKSLGASCPLIIHTKHGAGYFIEQADLKAFEQEAEHEVVAKKGSFIVFYGANNLGKSTQIMKLISKLSEQGHQSFVVLKFPIYDLKPTGRIIYEITHGLETHGIDYKSLEFQKLCAQNRIDFQHILKQLLDIGIDVIAEDYVGTGIAWGLTWGQDLKELENINFGVLQPDYSILLDGTRFMSSIEKGHKFESACDHIWQRNRADFRLLADRYTWKLVNGSRHQDVIHKEIWGYLKHAFHFMYQG